MARETVTPPGPAQALTPDVLRRWLGLSADGSLSAAVIADARANARQYPALHALLSARTVRRG